MYKFPTEYAEHTEPSGRESLPQIDTDTHRLGGYGIPAIPTLPITQPNHLWKSVDSVGEYYHAGAAASAAPTKQTERVSHRTRGTHRTFWQRKPPTDRHRLGGYGILPYPRRQPRGAAVSAAQTKQMARLLGWCTSCSAGALETSAPPKRHQLLCRSVKSVGEYPTTETSVNSVGGLQRVAWVWQDAIPSYKRNPWENTTTAETPQQNNSKQRNKI